LVPVSGVYGVFGYRNSLYRYLPWRCREAGLLLELDELFERGCQISSRRVMH
jgi:hypothetical protein